MATFAIPASTAVLPKSGTSASELITDALTKILVAARERPIRPEQMNEGIRYLNRMMAAFDARGISLGYTIVENEADEITVPIGALEGICANLSIRLAPIYNMRVSVELAKEAKDGMNAMLDIAVKVEPTCLPPTMPIGSGNEHHNDHRKFFAGKQSEILKEFNGSILTESDT